MAAEQPPGPLPVTPARVTPQPRDAQGSAAPVAWGRSPRVAAWRWHQPRWHPWGASVTVPSPWGHTGDKTNAQPPDEAEDAGTVPMRGRGGSGSWRGARVPPPPLPQRAPNLISEQESIRQLRPAPESRMEMPRKKKKIMFHKKLPRRRQLFLVA